MATNSGDGPPFNGRQTVKGFSSGNQDALQDDNALSLQQSASSKNSSKITFKNIFKGSGRSDKPGKTGKSGGKSENTGDKKGMWTFPQQLAEPTPMQILQIMESSPEHQLRLLTERAKKDAELQQQTNVSRFGHAEPSQSTDSVIILPTTDRKWSFDGKSMITYKRPDQSSVDEPQSREPGTGVSHGIWPSQIAIPHAVYQSDVRNEASASTMGPAAWSNVGVAGSSGTSFHDDNPSRKFPEHVSTWSKPPSHPINMSNLRTPYEIAEAAHIPTRPTSKAEWRSYLDDLHRGLFNITTPPNPPLIDPLFSYLPAVDPFNEGARVLSLFTLSPNWTPWQETRSRDFMGASMEEFGNTGVSISFIDTSHEILKAEMGCKHRMIKRSESIAAHALLTTDVMVVLDTKKDWRFAKNPLVVDEPKIRFFAGAPIISESSEIVGVFVIFGREPRDSFTPSERRSLTDYAAMCSEDLQTPLNESHSKESLNRLQHKANTESWDPNFLKDEPKQVRGLFMHEDTHRMLCGDPKEDETDEPKIPYQEFMMQLAKLSTHDDSVQEPRQKSYGAYAMYTDDSVQNPRQKTYGAHAMYTDNSVQNPRQKTYGAHAIYTDNSVQNPRQKSHGAHAMYTQSPIDTNLSTLPEERESVDSDYPLLGSDNEGPDTPFGRHSPRSKFPDSERFVWRPESPTSQRFASKPVPLFPADYPARPRSPMMSCTPRPYSGSDLTSVDGSLHLNTPVEGAFGAAISPSQTVQDVLDGTASALGSESRELPIRRQKKKSIRSISQYEEELRKKVENDIREVHNKATKMVDSDSTVAGSFNTSDLPSTQTTTPITSFNTRMSTLEFVNTHRGPEANAAAKFVALSLKFDRVYVAEIFPSGDIMRPDGVAVAGMGVRILAFHNCPTDMILDTNIHLQVLRSPLGAMNWHDEYALPGVFNKGLLIRLHSKGPYGVSRHHHTGGIVYAAVQLAKSEDGDNAEITHQERSALENAANEMKLILFKKAEKKDGGSLNWKASSHLAKHTTPTAAVKAAEAQPKPSVPAPKVETPAAESTGLKHPYRAPTFEAEYEEHPNSISVESMQEAARAVAEVMKFNMDEEMSPHW
ncbi:hypothetical protein V493_03784 [Pseudogymnoascus sp. VKM F-4281 (FW-2241)]|nr:hypothetical protein V493_03784 [Pseudogymnoascus sp. VKM F-4281 (FW-2241)]